MTYIKFIIKKEKKPDHDFLYLCELCPEAEIIEDVELVNELTVTEDKIIDA